MLVAEGYEVLAAVAAATPERAVAEVPLAEDGLRVGDLRVQVASTSPTVQEGAEGSVLRGGVQGQWYVARKLEDSYQILSVDNVPGPSRLTHEYRFPGKSLEMLPGGSVLIRKELYGEPEVIVDQPWAKDATGRPLPTKYLVKGDRLIQTIDVPGDATFPVVADPKLRKYWWGISYDFNKTETKKIAAGGTICAGVFAAAAALVTGPAGPIIAGACGVAAGVASWADAQGEVRLGSCTLRAGVRGSLDQNLLRGSEEGSG